LLGADVAFPVLHGPGGEDGSVQGLLEVLDVPYAGSDVEASAICMDKLVFKRLCAEHGIPQVDFVGAGEEGWRETLSGVIPSEHTFSIVEAQANAEESSGPARESCRGPGSPDGP
jgi:D-alanine-D-alanine ligase-like ATP-grasp enzyme